MEPTGGDTQMLFTAHCVSQPTLQGQIPVASSFPTPTNPLRGVCKIPAATSLGFLDLACWVGTRPWAPPRLLCHDFCLPRVSGDLSLCPWHCCHSGQGFVGALGTTSNTSGECQRARRDGTDHSPALYWKKVQWKFIFPPFPMAEWAAAALPWGPCSPGTRWQQDGTRMAEPDPCPPTPVPSPVWDQRDTVTALLRLKSSSTVWDNCGPCVLIRSGGTWAAACGAFRHKIIWKIMRNGV